MIKSVIDRLNDKNLSCDINTCDVRSSAITKLGEFGGHANNVIKIKDDKYGIDGTYMEDACWDAPNSANSRDSKGYSCCLYPIGDLYKLKNKLYIQEENIINQELMGNHKIVVRSSSKAAKMLKLAKSYLQRKGVYSENKENSAPIAVSKYGAALKTVVSAIKKEMSQEEVAQYVFSELEKTREVSHKLFNLGAESNFARYSSKE